MPFSVVSKKSGTKYFLHAMPRTTNTGKTVVLYYFSKKEEGAVESQPEGYVVSEAATGMPLLKRAN